MGRFASDIYCAASACLRAFFCLAIIWTRFHASKARASLWCGLGDWHAENRWDATAHPAMLGASGCSVTDVFSLLRL